MKVQLAIMDSSRTPTGAELAVRDLSAGRRLARALGRLGIVWGLIVPILFIPVVHFVMPFVLFALGPFFAVRAWRQTVLLTSAQIGCPKCEQQTAVAENTPGWPAHLFCTQCGTTFYASPAPASARPAGGADA